MPVKVLNDYEIEVTPEAWQTELRKALPKSIRDCLYNTVLPLYSKLPGCNTDIRTYQGDAYDEDVADYVYDASKRLYNIYKLADSPKILDGDKWYYTHNDDGSVRASIINIPYFPIIRGVNDENELIAELAHPIQRKYGKNGIDFIKQFRRRFNKKLDASLYKDKNNPEYETHSIFEPEIYNYIFKNEKPIWMK